MNLYDSVHVGDVVQNINNTNECPACKTANVSVFSCKEEQCFERWCTYCGTGKPGTCESCTATQNKQRITREELTQHVAECNNDSALRAEHVMDDSNRRNEITNKLDEFVHVRADLVDIYNKDKARSQKILLILSIVFLLFYALYQALWNNPDSNENLLNSSCCGAWITGFVIIHRIHTLDQLKKSFESADVEISRKIATGYSELHHINNENLGEP